MEENKNNQNNAENQKNTKSGGGPENKDIAERQNENNADIKIEVNNKLVIAIAAVLGIVLIIWMAFSLTSNPSDKNTGGGKSQQIAEETLRPDAKPIFKFFYSASDEKTAELMTVIEELQQTYGDRVVFDISDIDEHPEYVEQFSIVSPPQLYMLAANGDFADIKIGVYDKAELEDAINKTLE